MAVDTVHRALGGLARTAAVLRSALRASRLGVLSGATGKLACRVPPRKARRDRIKGSRTFSAPRTLEILDAAQGWLWTRSPLLPRLSTLFSRSFESQSTGIY